MNISRPGSGLFSRLPLLLLMWTVVPTPRLDPVFYAAFILSLPLEIAAMIVYVKALKISPLSLTLPFLSLTPVLLIFVSYIILGEQVSFQGGIGIVVLAAGGYTLHIREIRNGLWMPFRAIWREKGSLLMIGVAIIYSVTASLGKMAIEHSSPLFFGVTYFCAVTVLFAPIALWMGRHEMKQFIFTGQYKRLFFPGVFYSIMIASHMTALNLTKVAYMISVKRIKPGHRAALRLFPLPGNEYRRKVVGSAPYADGVRIDCNSRMIFTIVTEERISTVCSQRSGCRNASH